jgi:hypothetical protein
MQDGFFYLTFRNEELISPVVFSLETLLFLPSFPCGFSLVDFVVAPKPSNKLRVTKPSLPNLSPPSDRPEGKACELGLPDTADSRENFIDQTKKTPRKIAFVFVCSFLGGRRCEESETLRFIFIASLPNS